MSSYIITSCHLLSLSPSASRFMLGSHLRVSWWRLTAAELAFSVVPFLCFTNVSLFLFFLGGHSGRCCCHTARKSTVWISASWYGHSRVWSFHVLLMCGWAVWKYSFVFYNCPYVNININHRSILILKWPTNSILKNDLRGKIYLNYCSHRRDVGGSQARSGHQVGCLRPCSICSYES